MGRKNKQSEHILSQEDFKTSAKTSHQTPINKNQKRKDISPIDQINTEKKYRQTSSLTKSINHSPDSSEYLNSMNMNDSIVSDTQSQNIVTNNVSHDGTAPLQMAHMQLPLPHMQQPQFGQTLVGFQQQAHHIQPHIQPQGMQQAMFSLPDFEIDRIALRLKETFFADLESIVQQKVEEKTQELSMEIDNLRFELTDLRTQLSEASDKQEEAEQYSRRNCIRISNYAESPDECTDDIVMDVAKKAKVNIKSEDIDRSHRVNRLKREDQEYVNPGPRDIIVKFTSYKPRTTFIMGRKNLRESRSNIYINEDLTKHRKELSYECRKLKKDKNSSVTQTWSRDGKIFVRDSRDKTFRINSMFDIETFRPYD